MGRHRISVCISTESNRMLSTSSQEHDAEMCLYFSMAIAKATFMSLETLERVFPTMSFNGKIFSTGKRCLIGFRRLLSSRASLMRDMPSWTHKGAEGALPASTGYLACRMDNCKDHLVFNVVFFTPICAYMRTYQHVSHAAIPAKQPQVHKQLKSIQIHEEHLD